MTYNVLHGSTYSDTEFDFDGNKVAYFSDSRKLAEYFALREDEGGLLDGENATIIYADITLNNPLIVSEEDWEEVGDICNINEDGLIQQGYDGIVCTNESNVTYYVVFYPHQVKITKREIIKYGCKRTLRAQSA